MAFTDFYVRPGGSDLNSGSSDEDSAPFTFASGNWVQSTRVFTLASGDTTGVSVGMFAAVYADGSSATGYVGRITAVTSNTVTLNAASGSTVWGAAPTDGSGNRTMKIGGAMQTVAHALTIQLQDQHMENTAGDPARIRFSAGTFPVTGAITRSIRNATIFKGAGIDQTIIDGGTSGASYTVLTLSGPSNRFEDFTVRNNGATGSATGVVISASGLVMQRVRITGMVGYGVQFSNVQSRHEFLEIDHNNSSNTANLGGAIASGGVTLAHSSIHDNTGSNSIGIVITGTAKLYRCTVDRNGSHGVASLSGNEPNIHLENCDIYNNGGNGANFLQATGGSVYTLIRTNFVNNGGYGISRTSASNAVRIIERDCGFFGNVSGETSNYELKAEVSGRKTYLASPYTDADTSGTPRGGNFQTTAASGAQGYSESAIPQNEDDYDSASVSHLDIGAIQHEESSSGGGPMNDDFCGGIRQ